MDELFCFECNCHVGWITDNAPHGLVYCDDCHETESKNEDDEIRDDHKCFYCGQDSCDCDII